MNRSAGPEAVAHRLEERAVREDLRMAVHARLGRRDARKRRILDRGVAVPAVDAVAGDVPFVAELDRLLARDARAGDPRRAIDLLEQAEQAGDEEDRAEDADPSNRVGAAVEDLRHRSRRRTEERTLGELTAFCFRRGRMYFVKYFTWRQTRLPTAEFRAYDPGAFSQVYARWFAYFSNHSNSVLALRNRWGSAPH